MIVTSESWANSGYFKCGKCKEVNNNTIKVILFGIYNLIVLFASVNNTINTM